LNDVSQMTLSDASPINLRLTPRGHLLLVSSADAPLMAADLQRALVKSFTRGVGYGLLDLGASQVGTVLPPTFAWWRDLAARYVTALCALPDLQRYSGAEAATGPIAKDFNPPSVPKPDAEDLDTWIADAPPMQGAEYLSRQVLVDLWEELEAAFHVDLLREGTDLAVFLRARHPAWNLVGRVYFNLAENRKDTETPFAFMATYTARLSAHGTAQHLPLSKALEEMSDGKSQAKLLSLLQPVQLASVSCNWLRAMVDGGEIYHPLRWSAWEAYQFLTDVPKLEAAGILVRAPRTWAAGRPARPTVKASVGTKAPSMLGRDALLDFNMEVTLDGEALSASDVEALLRGSDGLQMLRGKWVEVDRKRLSRMLQQFQTLEAASKTGGLPLVQGLRLIAGASLAPTNDPAIADAADADWSQMVAGPWLAETLQGLRQPEGLAQISAGQALKATLRPYQEFGVRWLYLLTRLGLGACLADDMGLGKTIQVLALLLVLKEEHELAMSPSTKSSRLRPTTARHAPNPSIPSLLVVPATLLSNWAAEAERFAPSLRVLIVHPSAMPGAELRALDADKIKDADLVVTSYGTLLRWPLAEEIDWRLLVLDEAQAIKNPDTKQTRQVKKLKAQTRIALTGTPVENRLSDLWSIFDFTHPGLLGSNKVFSQFTKRLAQGEPFGPLRKLVQPYILRRLKTDKSVIADLPDKTELKSWCSLSAPQAALYQQAVKQLAQALESADGIARRGVVLAYLMRFKQICNHPSQWLGDGAWRAGDSGKFARLRELIEVIAAKQEKVLVFTQFRETTEPLAAFLGSIFGRDGLVLHGGTPVAKRRELVKQFQSDELTPFFVLSLKAGGAGLNLTAASHVIHFDRWWNPAVENQATDRAFRIGQKKNVLVHKFVCRGTVEDRIDALIESKQQLVKDVLEGGAELLLTEMSDTELLNLVKLDVHSAELEAEVTRG
jgi:superfamily II DNA or RNA helicase